MQSAHRSDAPGLRARVAAIDRGVLRIEGAVVAALVAVMTALIFAQVVFRYVLASPLVWSEELARYLFVWITMVGAGAAVHLGQHYGLDILTKQLPLPLQKLAGLLASALIGASGVTLVWQGLIEAARTVHYAASSVEVPMAWFYAAIPLGGALMLWHVAARLVVHGWGASALAAHH